MILTRSPSNIALVKYMGKEDPVKNLPSNPSLSMTLTGLCTYFEIEPCLGPTQVSSAHLREPNKKEMRVGRFVWTGQIPLQISRQSDRSDGNAQLLSRLRVPDLSLEDFQKVVRHLTRVIQFFRPGFETDQDWKLRSANTFPAASGVASSASSYSAMTLAAAIACQDDPASFAESWDSKPSLVQTLSALSRQGSGSSCRSFYGPWARWDGEVVRPIESVKLPALVDFVVLIDSSKKKVSSSEAHRQIKSSPLWERRPERVQKRIEASEGALREGDLKMLSQIAWAELWEMHSLFHTSAVPFTYWEGATLDGLNRLKPLLSESEPPIITLDAGPNIHILVPEASQPVWASRLAELFPGREILVDQAGFGPEVLSV